MILNILTHNKEKEKKDIFCVFFAFFTAKFQFYFFRFIYKHGNIKYHNCNRAFGSLSLLSGDYTSICIADVEQAVGQKTVQLQTLYHLSSLLDTDKHFGFYSVVCNAVCVGNHYRIHPVFYSKIY